MNSKWFQSQPPRIPTRRPEATQKIPQRNNHTFKSSIRIISSPHHFILPTSHYRYRKRRAWRAQRAAWGICRATFHKLKLLNHTDQRCLFYPWRMTAHRSTFPIAPLSVFHLCRFLDHFGLISKLKIGVEALSESFLQAGSGFSGFDADHFGGFWRGFGKHFWDILLSLVDVNFIMHFDLILRWFFIDFHALQTSKSEQIQWDILQKSNFRLVSYRMCLGIDFGRILESGCRHFCVPIGLQKRLRKQVL